MGDIVSVPDSGRGGVDGGREGGVHGMPEVLGELADPDPEVGDAVAEGEVCGVAVDEAVFVLAEAEHLVCFGHGDAVGGVLDVTR